HQREKIHAICIEFDLEAAWAAVAFEGGGAGAVAIGIGEFPVADHPLGGVAERGRRLCEGDASHADRYQSNRSTGHGHTIASVLPALRLALRWPGCFRNRREGRLTGCPGEYIVDDKLIHRGTGYLCRRAEMREQHD